MTISKYLNRVTALPLSALLAVALLFTGLAKPQQAQAAPTTLLGQALDNADEETHRVLAAYLVLRGAYLTMGDSLPKQEDDLDDGALLAAIQAAFGSLDPALKISQGIVPEEDNTVRLQAALQDLIDAVATQQAKVSFDAIEDDEILLPILALESEFSDYIRAKIRTLGSVIGARGIIGLLGDANFQALALRDIAMKTGRIAASIPSDRRIPENISSDNDFVFGPKSKGFVEAAVDTVEAVACGVVGLFTTTPDCKQVPEFPILETIRDAVAANATEADLATAFKGVVAAFDLSDFDNVPAILAAIDGDLDGFIDD